jgi:hypothetical protein
MKTGFIDANKVPQWAVVIVTAADVSPDVMRDRVIAGSA